MPYLLTKYGQWLACLVMAPSQLLRRPRNVEPLQAVNKSMCSLRLAMVRLTMSGSVRKTTKPKRDHSAQSVHGRVIAFWLCRNSFAGLATSRGCAVRT